MYFVQAFVSFDSLKRQVLLSKEASFIEKPILQSFVNQLNET